jgi:hypothetical protein
VGEEKAHAAEFDDKFLSIAGLKRGLTACCGAASPKDVRIKQAVCIKKGRILVMRPNIA